MSNNFHINAYRTSYRTLFTKKPERGQCPNYNHKMYHMSLKVYLVHCCWYWFACTDAQTVLPIYKDTNLQSKEQKKLFGRNIAVFNFLIRIPKYISQENVTRTDGFIHDWYKFHDIVQNYIGTNKCRYDFIKWQKFQAKRMYERTHHNVLQQNSVSHQTMGPAQARPDYIIK